MKKNIIHVLIGIIYLNMLLLPVEKLKAAPVGNNNAGSATGRQFESTTSLPSLFTSPVQPQTQTTAPAYVMQTDGYFTDTIGNILMYVNVWGEVGRPGQHAVPEGADIPTVLSIVGGPTGEANLSKVRVNRYITDDKGKQSYQVDMEKYLKDGDKTAFVELRPNDTIIVPEDKSIDNTTIFQVIGVVLSIATIALIN